MVTLMEKVIKEAIDKRDTTILYRAEQLMDNLAVFPKKVNLLIDDYILGQYFHFIHQLSFIHQKQLKLLYRNTYLYTLPVYRAMWMFYSLIEYLVDNNLYVDYWDYNVEYVYFINVLGGDYIKIGRSSQDVRKRMRQLQVGSPRQLVLAGYVETYNSQLLEKIYHEMFSQYRVKKFKSEYFLNSDTILRVVGDELIKPEKD